MSRIRLFASLAVVVTAPGLFAPAPANAAITDDADVVPTSPTAPSVATPPSATNSGTPPAHRTSTDIGGIAAQVFIDEAVPVPGRVITLMGKEGSQATATAYVDTAYGHSKGLAPDTAQSIVDAHALVAEMTGHALAIEVFTNPPAGGSSCGLAYTIAYLNIATRGRFTDSVAVAATGGLQPGGVIMPISAIDEKTAAAELAGAEVLFTPSRSQPDTIDRHVARFDGRQSRAVAGSTLEERIDDYMRLGADRPTGMDVVGVRHIVDVAAYLCGAGSQAGCALIDDAAAMVASPAIDLAPVSPEANVGRALR
ncbi:MAG: hypothetical protein AAGA42_11700 [Actinomycetota bacterium]